MKEVINWRSVFSIVDQLCAEFDEDTSKVQAELISIIKKHNLIKVDRKKFNQWVTAEILTPGNHPDTSGYPIYDHLETKKAILAAYLYNTYELRPSEIRIATQLYATGIYHDIPALHVRDLDQGQRARLILTGRILGVSGALALKMSTPPQNTIIICHKVTFETEKIPMMPWRRDPTEIPELIKPHQNLIGWSGEEPYDEVFPLMKEKRQVDQRLGDRDFFSIPIPYDGDRRSFAITLGIHNKSNLARSLKEDEQLDKIFALPESLENKLLAHLFEFGLSNILNIQEALWNKLPQSRLKVDATLFNILVTTVLLRKPNNFFAAAFYGFDGNDALYCRAHSPTYPVDNYPSAYVLTKKLSPFSWVFSHRTQLIVNRPSLNDFRLSNEISTPVHSHAFIPAIQGNNCSGVLHVIGEFGDQSNGLCFTYEDIGLLFVIARVIGEAYQRNVIASMKDVCSILPFPDVSQLDVSSLNKTLHELIGSKEFLTNKVTILSESSENYLTLFAIRLQPLQGKNVQVAYINLIKQRLFTYFHHSFISKQGVNTIGDIFQVNETQLVFIVDNMRETDVKRIRSEIQENLDEISSINPNVRTQCAVWSVHIPYDYLITNFNLEIQENVPEEKDRNIVIAVDDIISRTYAALKVIWQVRAADAALKQHNYREAESILSDALILDNKNSYIWRHLAQARFGLGKYLDAEIAAQNAIEIDAEKNIHFASNYQRLAEALFGLKKYDDAFENMKKACNHSRDLRYRLVFIQLLILHNTPNSLEMALAMIIDASAQIEPTDNINNSWLEFLRGEARLRTGETNQALEAFEKAASLRPAYRDPEWDILRIKFRNDSNL